MVVNTRFSFIFTDGFYLVITKCGVNPIYYASTYILYVDNLIYLNFIVITVCFILRLTEIDSAVIPTFFDQ